MKTKFTLLITFLFACNFVYAQTWQWATDKIGTKSYAIVVDALGNSYVTGEFSGTTIIGNDTLISTNIDIFIAKINNVGTPVWGVKAGGSNQSYEMGTAITLDNFGNLYVMGTISSPIVIFGSDTLTTTNNYSNDFFAKLDTSGNFLWAQTVGHNVIPAPGHWRPAGGVSTDNSGNIYVTGTFLGTGVFDTITLVSNGGFDMFIAKYNSTGSCLWAKKAGAGSWDMGCAIKTDAAGNSYVAGRFYWGVINFDTIQVSLPNPFAACIVVKYNSSGVAQMVTYGTASTSNGGGVTPSKIDIDNSGNIYVTGNFSGSVFGLSSASTLYEYAFTTKFNASGVNLWARKGGGNHFNGDWGEDIAVDGLGNCYVTGRVNSQNAVFSQFTPAIGMFVIAYNSSGTALWIRQPSGTGNYNSGGFGIDLDGNNTIYVAGSWRGDTINFSSTSFYNNGADRGIVAKIDHSTTIFETVENNFINLFPNPATSEIIVESGKFNVERIEMWNVVGERVLTHPQPPLSNAMANAQRGLRIDVSSLRAGIYFVAVTDDAGNRVVRKVVKM